MWPSTNIVTHWVAVAQDADPTSTNIVSLTELSTKIWNYEYGVVNVLRAVSVKTVELLQAGVNDAATLGIEA